GSSPGPALEHLAALVRFVPLTIGLYVASLFSSADHSIAYLFPHEAIPLGPGEQAVAMALGIGLVVFLIWTFRRRRDLLLWSLVFLGLMLPYFNVLVVILWRADRYVYLSSFCVLAIVVQLVFDLLAMVSHRSRLALPAVA